MPTTTQTGGLSSQTLEGADGANNTDIIYGDANKLKGNTVGGDDSIIGGDEGAINFLYGDAYSIEGKAKGGADKITGGANGSTNYIYGDAYSMQGKVQGGNDILVGGIGSKNIIYGDAYTMIDGVKGGDDDISLANSSSLVLNPIICLLLDGSKINFISKQNLNIQDNKLIGDADSITNSSSGIDSISIGNNSKVDIGEIKLQSFNGSDVNALSKVGLDISKNLLIGDAKSMKNSSSGNDVIAIGKNMVNQLSRVSVASFSSNSKASTSSEININFSSNKLMGDAENIVNSSAGYDNLTIGDSFQNTVGVLETVSNNGGAASSEILLNFKFLDNTLLGDADNMKSSNSGNDVISLGNNIINLFTGINSNANAIVVAFGTLPIASTFSANFSLGSNTLIGDAVSIENSSAGDDVISVGNNFQNYLGSITNRTIGGLSVYSTESASFSLSDNILIGDAKYMNGVSGGKDVIELGNNFKNNFGVMTSASVNFAEDKLLAKMTYSATGNTLIGDSQTIKNSGAGDDEIGLANNAENVFAGVGNFANHIKSATISEIFTFNVSNNTLFGDAENMKNSHSGNDEILVASAFSSAIGFIQNDSSGNMVIADTSLLLDYALSENKIIGDSQNMQNSNGGDDNIFVGENVKNSVISISNNISFSGVIESKIISNFSFADNILFGDAEAMHNSSGGHDNINLGNNFKNNIGPANSFTNTGFLLESSFLSTFSLTGNALMGDSKTMNNSTGSDDAINIGNGYISTLGDQRANLFGHNDSIHTSTINFVVSENILIGDAKTMSYSQGGCDTIRLANDFLSKVGDINFDSRSLLTTNSSTTTNFNVSNNELFGDAESMIHSKGGNDAISMGNYINNTIGSMTNYFSQITKSTVIEKTVLSIIDNDLAGDARLLFASRGGDDDISVGNNFFNLVGEISSSFSPETISLTSASVIFSLSDNNLYGDAEIMAHSKGSNDTLSIGVSIFSYTPVNLQIFENMLFGDAKTMTHSQGGNDKLTGADGRGSVTYLYGDAQFTDGHSKAGDDVLTSGQGNDQMWGDFASVLNPATSSNDHDHEDDDGGYGWDEHESERDDDHHASNPYKYAGKDTFVFKENNGNDTIFDFQHGLDKIDLSAANIFSVDGLHIEQSAAHPSDIVIDLGGGNSITLVGVSNVVETDFVFAGISI